LQNDSESQANDPADDLHDAAAAFGLQIVGGDQPVPDQYFWLWPESCDLWMQWLRLQTQWQVGPMGQRIGLRYEAVEAWLRAAGYTHGRQRGLHRALQDIAEMESAALRAWSKN